ncbi:transcriptional regulator [Vibrio tubiashii]|uniref:transcriptional regulator n=1 Tax=Vibrio tubiashii TaxID=29498 RepID=UPI001EFCA913|nr:transcriptional regulator [Vibrio tubiashii]MCG9579949.1 transcriptional regulator [Vibrio tubiashii]MCG9613540.1 transcriptional regulator [Vibrio tubiashii]MCG9687708.1 transcriptional regulator [Vibrio tubiashii]
MSQLDTWVEQIGIWYQHRKHDQGSNLESLILSPPEQIWGPLISDQQSKAIACWLDGCLRIFNHARYDAPDKAYQFLQLAYSKLQNVVSNPASELELKDWCMKRMQHLTVLSLEFCNQQSHCSWQEESHQLIDAHVQFMAAHAWNEPRNDDQGISSVKH